MIAQTQRANIFTKNTSAQKYIDQAFMGSQAFNHWLLSLDQKTLHKAFVYSGYTEHSYLLMAWEDYCHNKTEFLLQWSQTLLGFYHYLQHKS
ncbi:MAG: hypothetical protein OEX12_04710 [Gammaproteobacteria bacterium]|nr:hypothetical protein [Gammaproteobacteria bacterium]